MTIRKFRNSNIILLTISLTTALVLGEIGYRYLLFSDIAFFDFLKNPGELAPNYDEEHRQFYGEDYWKLNFLFHQEFTVGKPHPLLGWIGRFDRKSLSHHQTSEMGDRRPVLLYGDSYAMCVDSVQCFEDILNGDSLFSKNHFLLNYGVGGYGLDQITLLCSATVDQYENPLVILSLLTTDLDRCMLKVRDGQKPYYTLEENHLKLSGVPIVRNSNSYFERHPPEISSYLYARFRNAILYRLFPDQQPKAEHIEKIQALSRKILENTFAQLKSKNLDFVVLIFQPEHHANPGWRLEFIIEMCLKHEVPFATDLELRSADSRFKEYQPAHYAIPGNGHPTSHANQLVAEEIQKIALLPEYKDSLLQNNPDWKSQIFTKDQAFYEKQMLGSEKWMKTLNVKAKNKGVALEKVMAEDAQYLVRLDSEKYEWKK